MNENLPPLPGSVNAGRDPQWNKSDLTQRPCPVCRGARFDVFCHRPDGLPVVRCEHCGMFYVRDVPSGRQIHSFYCEYDQFKRLAARTATWIRNYWRARTDAYYRILVASGGVRGKRVTEVGCSYGSFLQLLRYAGATVSGVELDQDALRFLESLQIPAHEILRAEASQDVICALQLIEHLADPAAFLAQASAALVEDGRLLLSLPNGGEAEKVGPTWIGFRVDLEHLNYFSIKTLAQLLSQHGLFVEHFWECDQPRISRETPPRSPIGALGRRLRASCRGNPPRLHPDHDSGTFVLTLLARKCGRGVAVSLPESGKGV